MSEQGQLLDVTVDASARRDDDFYRTPDWMTFALLRRLRLQPGWRFFEPCAGDGAIVRLLPSSLEILTNDIVAREPQILDFQLDARQRLSWLEFGWRGPIDVVGTNPTFEHAFDIARLGFERCERALILLNRITWLEPTEDRGDWLEEHPPTSTIVLPRWNFRTVDGKGGSDSAPPAWFIWAKDPQVCAPGVHIVGKRERAELHALSRGYEPPPLGETGIELTGSAASAALNDYLQTRRPTL
ncbi:MAG: hypothetical protein AB7Q29_14965 [Vicinamibacterales bacterium]